MVRIRRNQRKAGPGAPPGGGRGRRLSDFAMRAQGVIGMLLLCAAALLCAGEAWAAPRNIILFVADDLGLESVGCYGNPKVKTPGIDALAASGTQLTNAFCTTASCSPSRSVLLTGRQNHANGMYGLQHSAHHFRSFDTTVSLPARLAEAGYRTILAGKYHVGPEANYPFSETIRGNRPERMAEEARELIAADDERPFFLYFCTTEPHRPFMNKGFPVPEPEEVVVPDWLPDLPETRKELARYYASIAQCDSGVEALLRVLKETGHWEDTLFVLVSDNGAPFPGAKTTHYEPGVRLPCIVRNPSAEKFGGSCNALVTFCDITPTLLDFAGVASKPEEFHGRSFLPVLSVENPEGWDEAFLSHTFHEVTMYYPMRTLRERQYKLIWNIAHELPFPFATDLHDSETWQAVLKQGLSQYGKRSVDAFVHRPEFELYDIEADPDETNNLAGAPEMAQTLGRMQARIRALQEATDDPWELKWDRE